MAKYICFHGHSSFAASFPQRSFVFSDIPALFVRFSMLLVLSFPAGCDISSYPAVRSKCPLHPASLKCSRQEAAVAQVPFSGPAAVERQSAIARRKKAIHSTIQLNPQFRIQHCLSPTYYTSLSCAACQETQSSPQFTDKVVERSRHRVGSAGGWRRGAMPSLAALSYG